ncbi:nucleotidyltransferase family protein [Ulvibacterium sp.]|uniref:nucleotidyltransferase family protein n=1 Tax=Ulvibacterium sp. TaxID=2665914 RepID=UPI0026102D7B|nr:nucleotidyltransferase family protein [Ulvibacterium sp.]
MGKTVGNITVLILAAGASTRMGTPKQLLPWNGTNLLDNAIKNASEVCPERVVVVLGANADKIKEKCSSSADVRFVFHKNWDLGLGSSIAYGVDFIQNSLPNTKAILILLCDQPLIDSKYLDQKIQTYKNSGKGIVATEYEKGAGVPAIFGKSYFSNLAQLNKDVGAKEIIRKFKNDTLSLNPSGKTLDIDTLEDYQKLTKM